MTLERRMQRYSDKEPFAVIEGKAVPVTPQITRSLLRTIPPGKTSR